MRRAEETDHAPFFGLFVLVLSGVGEEVGLGMPLDGVLFALAGNGVTGVGLEVEDQDFVGIGCHG